MKTADVTLTLERFGKSLYIIVRDDRSFVVPYTEGLLASRVVFVRLNTYSRPGSHTIVNGKAKSVVGSKVGSAGRCTILVVEDNNVLREALAYALELMGHTVYEACSGNEALALAERVGQEIELVISDLVMPGMNALALYEALELERRRGKMLIITGYPMPHTGATLVERPGVRWARKPIGLEQLRELVGQMLGR